MEEVWGYQSGTLFEVSDCDLLFNSLETCYKWFVEHAGKEGFEIVSFAYMNDVIKDRGCYSVTDEDSNIELTIWKRKIY